MSNKELSLQLFNQGLEAKRQGRFAESVRLQQESIRAYPEDPDLPQNFYSMGKTLYLAGKYNSAVVCYAVYNTLTVFRNPALLAAWKKARQGDRAAENALYKEFYIVAKHIGHASMDPEDGGKHTRAISFYQAELMGKHPERDPQMSKDLDAVIAYEGATVQNGMEVVVEGLQELADHEQEHRKNTTKYMNVLVSAPFEKMQ